MNIFSQLEVEVCIFWQKKAGKKNDGEIDNRKEGKKG